MAGVWAGLPRPRRPLPRPRLEEAGASSRSDIGASSIAAGSAMFCVEQTTGSAAKFPQQLNHFKMIQRQGTVGQWQKKHDLASIHRRLIMDTYRNISKRIKHINTQYQREQKESHQRTPSKQKSRLQNDNAVLCNQTRIEVTA